MRPDFAIFICTHGRPTKQFTFNMLKNLGYTGKIYLVLDDTDSTIQEHIDLYGVDSIFVFNKNYYMNTAEVGTNKPTDKCILYAKCAVEDIAKSLKLRAFVVCDDDITDIKVRVPDFVNNRLPSTYINLDKLFELTVEYMISGDFVGMGYCIQTFFMPGIKIYDNDHINKLCLSRIPYQFIFRNSSHQVKWSSYFGEDDITELLNNYYRPWYSLPLVCVLAKEMGGYANTLDGMAETYKKVSEFTRNMQYMIFRPDCVKIVPYKSNVLKKEIQIKRVLKENAFPKIISWRYMVYCKC